MAPTAPPLRWKVIDIVTATVLSVACGLIFVVWNQMGGASYEFLRTIGSDVGGLMMGVQLLDGTLGNYVIRKPGAALFVELMTTTVSMTLGSQWAVETIYSGLAQGFGAEVVFVLVTYRRFNATTVSAAGTVFFAFEWVLELFLSGHLTEGVLYNVIYLVCGVASGVVLAGLPIWALASTLMKTGALDRFASGHGARELV